MLSCKQLKPLIISSMKYLKKAMVASFAMLFLVPMTVFAVNTNGEAITYEIDENYYVSFQFPDDADTDEYLRIRVTADETGEFKEDHFQVPTAGSLRTFVLPRFFEQLEGEGDYSVEFSVCEADGGEEDAYCEDFAEEAITYERVALAAVVLPSAPIAGYEDGVLGSYEDYYVVFPDVNEEALEGTAALELYRRNVIGGYSDGEFKGGNDVNRAEAAKFLMLARYGLFDLTVTTEPFPDVPVTEWFAPYVKRCAEEGIINGYPDGDFKPADTVNTAEFLKMLTLTFDLEEGLPYTYTDVSETDWFSVYAGAAQHYDLLPERGTQLLPDQNMTRNEVAVAIYQYFLSRDGEMSESASMLSDLFSGLDAEMCTSTDDPNKVASCSDYADQIQSLYDTFIEEWVQAEFGSEFTVEDFWSGSIPMTLYLQETTAPVVSDSEGGDIEVETSAERDTIFYLAFGDKRDEFEAMDSDFEMEDLGFDVLRFEAASYSYDGGHYYGPGYLAYEWTGAGYQEDGYYGMRLIDYAQTDPYSSYAGLFHVFGSEYNKTLDTVINPMGVLHYYVNNAHYFVDDNGLSDGSVMYYVEGELQ